MGDEVRDGFWVWMDEIENRWKWELWRDGAKLAESGRTFPDEWECRRDVEWIKEAPIYPSAF